MLIHRRQPMTGDESRELDESERPIWFERLFFRQALKGRMPAERVTDEYDVTVESCTVPANFNETIPVYFLDLGGEILTLGGQWIDNVPDMQEEHFEQWAETGGGTFFARQFTMRGHASRDLVFSLKVTDPRLMPTRPTPVPLQFNRLRNFEIFDGSAETLMQDLLRVGLAEPE
jgi:hypothetical protein